MDLDDVDTADYVTVHEVMDCCGGLRSMGVCTHLVDGQTLSITVAQHALWCVLAPPVG